MTALTEFVDRHAPLALTGRGRVGCAAVVGSGGEEICADCGLTDTLTGRLALSDPVARARRPVRGGGCGWAPGHRTARRDHRPPCLRRLRVVGERQFYAAEADASHLGQGHLTVEVLGTDEPPMLLLNGRTAYAHTTHRLRPWTALPELDECSISQLRGTVTTSQEMPQ